MKTTLSIDGSIHMALRDALLIYRTGEGTAAYVTHHNIRDGQLGPATPLTGDFVEQLQVQLRKRMKMEVLPPNVLARTQEAIVWWTPAQQRRMYFVSDDETMRQRSGGFYPQPPLVWMVKDEALSVRALPDNERPHERTPLCVAPYWNVNDQGEVCLGDSPTPETVTTQNLDAWVDGFFASRFSHPNADKLVKGAGRYHNFLMGIENDATFPMLNLLDAKETLGQFIGGND